MKAVAESVNAERVVELTRRMVRISSQYSPDPALGIREHGAITSFLKDLYTSLGFEVTHVEPQEGFPVLVARLRGTTGKPTLGFTGHYNTRPIGDRALWDVDPLGADIKDGRIWGRGSGDMKKAIAAAIEAARAVQESGVELKGDILHAWFAGEGAHDSALEWMAGAGWSAAAADWYVDTDGGPRIAKLAAPLVWLELRTRGVAGHAGVFLEDGSKPINAMTKMVRLLSRLEDVDAWMKYVPHPLYGLPWRTSTKPFIEIYKIADGMLGHIPDRCSALVEFYLLPGQSPEQLLRELDAMIGQVRAADPDFAPVEVKVIQTFHNKTPWELTEDHPVVEAILEVATPILGYKPEFIGAESGVRPALREVADIVTFGVPGGNKAHAPNESTSIDGLVSGTKIYAGLLEKLLTSNAGDKRRRSHARQPG
jgi:succinyl-diaminopimelate desuccinylase